MTVVVLLGPPGAGKGTQAALLQDRLRLPHLATGELFRAAVREGTPLGREAGTYMSAGRLVPDELTIGMLRERLGQPDAVAGFILDGFPRTAGQAISLDALLAERGAAVNVALLIDVPAEDLIRRLAGRWICQSAGHVYHVLTKPSRMPGICDIDGSPLVQRDDDRAETVRARLSSQLDDLNRVVEHYRAAGVLHKVDGRRPIEAVAADLVAATHAAVGA